MPKQKPIIAADITEGLELDFVIPRMLKECLREIGPGKRVRVDIKEFRPRRTLKQNAYLWAAVYPMICQYIKDTTGQVFTPEEIHERNKRKYLGYEVCEIKGMGDLVKPRSSTELDTQEFWDEFTEHVCREWSELGLYIPLPEKPHGQRRQGSNR